MNDDPYVYPGTATLRTKLGIRDAARLDRAERAVVTVRGQEGAPTGRFDLAHLRAIHGHLFPDVYDWAGEVRTVEIAKGGSRFMPRRFIATGMGEAHGRLVRAGFLRSLDRDGYAQKAGRIDGDVDHVHPFREGNGPTQVLRLKRRAEGAGWSLDLTRIDREAWMAGSVAAQAEEYGGLGEAIGRALGDVRR